MSKRKRTSASASASPPIHGKVHLGTVSLSDGDTDDEGARTTDATEALPVQNQGADAVTRFGLDKTLKDHWRSAVQTGVQHCLSSLDPLAQS